VNQIVLEGRFDPSDRKREEFPLLPFEVPAGIGRLHVAYEVEQRLGADEAGWQRGNIIDIGIFDPRGAQFLSAAGFRGWSGSARTAFHLSEGGATPGYLPGPICSGTWHIVLGLYQIAPQGCEYRITISLEQERNHASPPAQASQTIRSSGSGPRWYRGDLHAHTWHSDGSAPLNDLVAAARAQSLDFVAVTEHNTVSHLPLLQGSSSPDLLLIPGEEISTYHGHANVWPVDSFVEFRCTSTGEMAQVRDAVRSRHALFSVNHPKDGGPDWEFDSMLDPDCVEVWGGPWIISNYQALAAWDRTLQQGRRITAVGGSDKHQGPFSGELGWYELGTPCTWVYAEELTYQAVLSAVQDGRVFVSESPNGPLLEMTAEWAEGRATMGDALVLPPGTSFRVSCQATGAAGHLLRLVSPEETRQFPIDRYEFGINLELVARQNSYWRAEVIEPPEVPLDEEPAALMAKALGNPIYIRIIS
jgi:hypothetical protein